MKNTAALQTPTDRLGHRICDYSDTDYSMFWADGQHTYEDLAERIALRRLTADFSGACLEIGGGYGRLTNEYAQRCSRVLLTDLAENLLTQAHVRMHLLGLEQVKCRRMNLYELEHAGEQFDSAVCVRVLHHVEAVPDFFRQVNLALREGGTFVLEYANKRNILEILRWLFHCPNLRPFDRQPSERKQNVYYNFHPAYIREMLEQNGFQVEQELSVSIFRNRFLKRMIGAERLANMERPLQKLLGPLHLSPSVFVRACKVTNIP